MSAAGLSIPLILAAALLAAAPLAAQDFGFGDPETADPSGPAAAGARVGGELSVGGSFFLENIASPWQGSLGDLTSARLDFSASGAQADADIRLKLSADILRTDPTRLIDEARLRLFLGNLVFEGGLLKVMWGRADSQGPLDILNPDDLRDLTVTDAMERKIAQPMLRASYSFGEFSRIEAVFLPGFEAHRIAAEGRWTPAAVQDLEPLLAASGRSFAEMLPDGSGLNHAQAGVRFTATTASLDWGLQYFYGFLPMPAAEIDIVLAPGPVPQIRAVRYNRYHHFGVDAAILAGGFNLRAEAAANITEDLEGDDPAVYNPSLAFSLGFDRDLFSGINLNLQYHGSYRLMHERIASAPLAVDIEEDALSSWFTGVLSQRLFKDTFEWRLTALWGIQDRDFLVMPSLVWQVGDAEIECAAGFFGGERDGELGQYGDNSYLTLGMRYRF